LKLEIIEAMRSVLVEYLSSSIELNEIAAEWGTGKRRPLYDAETDH